MIMRLGGQPVRGEGRGSLVRMLRDAEVRAPRAVDGAGNRASVKRRQAMGVASSRTRDSVVGHCDE